MYIHVHLFDVTSFGRYQLCGSSTVYCIGEMLDNCLMYKVGKDTQDTKYCIAYISNILNFLKIQRWCVDIDEMISCDL